MAPTVEGHLAKVVVLVAGVVLVVIAIVVALFLYEYLTYPAVPV